VIAARRIQKGNDILSALLAVEEQGDRLDHDELVAMALLLLIAGHETTANLLGNGLLALLNHPEQWNRFKHDASLDHTATEELLRFDGPIQMTERITLDDTEIGDTRIPKGRIVILCLAAANRDSAVFKDPDSLDISRDPNPHLAFSAGAHFCLGAPLARLEARLALRAIAERLPNLKLKTTAMRWRPSFTIRGLKELRLTW
jgi:cytochrome P450